MSLDKKKSKGSKVVRPISPEQATALEENRRVAREELRQNEGFFSSENLQDLAALSWSGGFVLMCLAVLMPSVWIGVAMKIAYTAWASIGLGFGALFASLVVDVINNKKIEKQARNTVLGKKGAATAAA